MKGRFDEWLAGCMCGNPSAATILRRKLLQRCSRSILGLRRCVRVCSDGIQNNSWILRCQSAVEPIPAPCCNASERFYASQHHFIHVRVHKRHLENDCEITRNQAYWCMDTLRRFIEEDRIHGCGRLQVTEVSCHLPAVTAQFVNSK